MISTVFRNSQFKVYRIVVIIAVIAYCIDRITKYLAVQYLDKPVVFIPGFLQLEFIGNTHFLFYWQFSPIIMFTSILLVLAVIVYIGIHEYRLQHTVSVALLLCIVVGAFSNLLDRIKYGYVIDFISVPFWSVFNLADMYIVIGSITLMVYSWKNENNGLSKENENHAAKQKISTHH